MNKEESKLFNTLISNAEKEIEVLKENLYEPKNSNILNTDTRDETPEERDARHARNDYTREYNKAIQQINNVGEKVYGRTDSKGKKLVEALASDGFLSTQVKGYVDIAIPKRNKMEHPDPTKESFTIVGREAYEQTKAVADEVEKRANEIFGTVGSIDNLLK